MCWWTKGYKMVSRDSGSLKRKIWHGIKKAFHRR